MDRGVASMADIESIEALALSERNLPQSTYEALLRGERINPDKIALRFFLHDDDFADQVFYTYKDVIGLVNQTANMFHDLGIRTDDVVSLILPNLPQSFFAFWGAEAAGIANPISPLLEPAMMADIMNAVRTRVLVTLAPFPSSDIWSKVAAIADQVESLETILQVNLTHYLPTMHRLAVRLINFRAAKEPVTSARVLDFGQAASRYPAESLISGREIRPTDLASYFHAGETDGTPRLAGLTHFSEVYDAWAAAQFIDAPTDKVFLCRFPLDHVYGVIVSGMLPFMHGASLVLGTPQGHHVGMTPNFWSIVEHYRINIFSGVPSDYRSLLAVPREEQDISSLEYAVCGTALLPAEDLQAFEQRTGVSILQGYGLTEGTCVCSVNPPFGERRSGSIGFRLPYQEMKVARLDQYGRFEADCDDNETGSIIVRGPNVFAGYLQEEQNTAIWIDPGDGSPPWLNTGDLGRRDAQGYFWLTGQGNGVSSHGNEDPG